MQLYEKYRPKTFEQVLGQTTAVQQIKTVLKQRWGGRAFWISGASGTGKTTLARIIAGLGADSFFVNEYDSADSLTTAVVDDIERSMQLYSWGKGGRAYIINESHGLRQQIIRRLLGILERIPRHVVFIFTTTKLGQKGLFEAKVDASPLLSRCIYIELTEQGLTEIFAEHCKKIAQTENLDGQPIVAYLNMAKSFKNNCRAMLQSVESGQMRD